MVVRGCKVVSDGARSDSEVLAGDPIRCIRLHRRRHVGVDLPRDVSGGVIGPVADDLDVDAHLKRQATQGMTLRQL